MIIKEERGAALITVLLLIMLFVILSSVFVFAMTTEGIQAARYNHKTQAYYLARSGAEAVAASIVEEIVTPDYYITNPVDGNFGNGTFEVNVTSNPNEVIITSTGEVAGINDRVIVRLVRTGAMAFNFGIKTKDTIELHNNSEVHNGDVGTNLSYEDHVAEFGEIDEDKILHGNAYYGINADFPDFITPTGPLTENEFKVEDGPRTLNQTDGPFFYNKIKVEGHSLTFNTGMDSNDMVVVVHGEFKVEGNGSIAVTGNGRLLLYAEKIKFENDAAFSNVNSGAQLLFFVSGGHGDTKTGNNQSFKLENFSNFRGAVYAPNAIAKFENAITMTGSIVARRIIAEDEIKIYYEAIDEDGLFDAGDTGFQISYWSN